MNYNEFPGSELLRLDQNWPPNPQGSRLVGKAESLGKGDMRNLGVSEDTFILQQVPARGWGEGRVLAFMAGS